ncbi:hypothetical protein DS745_07515 [Anaerobacillus alkaliphilus]|uniref:Uncharacterized protein n=1 Tax=Anaerobacillus alkaliphilus TaxID=1548597 RepID=A0A4Q0VUR5_9BACI|nr:hypothetical protein DS745_07515 [Anaerobacillus alkaliphilus]
MSENMGAKVESIGAKKTVRINQ